MKKSEQIINRACEFFSVHKEDVLGKTRNYRVTAVRHAIMYLLRDIELMPLTEIGRVMNRDHASVIHGAARMRELIRTDMEWAKLIAKFREVPFELMIDDNAWKLKSMCVSAKQQDKPFRWNGKRFKAGDYLVLNGETFAVDKESFEKFFVKA